MVKIKVEQDVLFSHVSALVLTLSKALKRIFRILIIKDNSFFIRVKSFLSPPIYQNSAYKLICWLSVFIIIYCHNFCKNSLQKIFRRKYVPYITRLNIIGNARMFVLSSRLHYCMCVLCLNIIYHIILAIFTYFPIN